MLRAVHRPLVDGSVAPAHPPGGRQPEGIKCVRFGLRGKLETSLPKRKKDTHPRFNILYFTEVLKEAETYVCAHAHG